jgi:ABC-type antimicrobial peptide transport system permease subunit
MGIKKSDLFDIFFFQGLIVSLIGYVLSIVLYLLSNKFISSKLNELIAIELLPHIPNIKTLLINLILIIVISLISSFISLFSITKLKICDILKED